MKHKILKKNAETPCYYFHNLLEAIRLRLH